MAYASPIHVQALNTGRLITGSSNPNATQVGFYLDQTAAVLDSILREKGYGLPIPSSATGALKTLENFNAIGADYFSEVGAKDSKRVDEAKAMWEWAQKMLQDGIIELDAPLDIAQANPRGLFPATPFFARDDEY